MVYDIYLTVSIQLSAISYQLSAISYQLSAISYQLSAISYQLSAISYQPMGHRVEACATVLFAQREPKADG
ncbi:MAG: hypothetical protein F6J94_04870 [Moorea sp. SIO1F2]|uniref:hypothetical protein n=1 Tax=Moorena sp. SIO1F2 TaxID=2607819 RepID=UPI0013B7B981|nr:hypothetical protein [Moorena sp. SIO1F2]NET81309.1 hypothetical protein [Moorena sp. SIO1F2]